MADRVCPRCGWEFDDSLCRSGLAPLHAHLTTLRPCPGGLIDPKRLWSPDRACNRCLKPYQPDGTPGCCCLAPWRRDYSLNAALWVAYVAAVILTILHLALRKMP